MKNTLSFINTKTHSMKKVINTIFFFLFVTTVTAQSVKGALLINEQSKAEIQLPSNKIVNLYADFRQGKHQILFRFEGNSLPLNSEKQQVVSIVFITTIKKDGKVVASSKRAPIPFFPGDMFMPVETFDFISLLSNLQTNTFVNVSAIEPGTYQIELEAKPVLAKGELTPLRFLLIIPG